MNDLIADVLTLNLFVYILYSLKILSQNPLRGRIMTTRASTRDKALSILFIIARVGLGIDAQNVFALLATLACRAS